MSEPLYKIGDQIIFYWPDKPTDDQPDPVTVSGMVTEVAHTFEGWRFDEAGEPLTKVTMLGYSGFLYYVKVDPSQTVASYPNGNPLQSEVVREDQISTEEIPF